MKVRVPGLATKTLAEAYSGRDNAFNFMRLCFAAAVIVAHGRVLGFGTEEGLPVDISGLAVAGFFGLSGFLISRSAQRTSFPRFWWHRILRIFPAYWVCIGLTAFVLAPVLWWRAHGTLRGLRSAVDSPVQYVYLNFFADARQFGIAGLLSDVPYQRVFNGSLWTLKYELTCYAVVSLLAATAILRRARPLAVLLALAVLSVVAYDFLQQPTVIGPVAEVAGVQVPGAGLYLVFYMVMYGGAFLVGMLADLYRDRVPINDALGVASGVVVLVAIVLKWPLLGPAIVAYVYLLLWLGVRLPGWLRRIGRRNDYSYGVYIYGFPVQQILALSGVPKYGLLVYLLASLVVTFGIAMLSWHLVEKPALRLKDWSPPFVRRPAAEQARMQQIAAELPPAAHPAPTEHQLTRALADVDDDAPVPGGAPVDTHRGA